MQKNSMAGRTLPTLMNDMICSHMRFVGRTRNGYCHRSIELVRASRQILVRIQELETTALEKAFAPVLRDLQTALKGQSPEASFKKATESLIAFCKREQVR